MVHSELAFTGADSGDSCSSNVVVVPEPYASFGHIFDCADEVDDSFLEGVYYVESAQAAWADLPPLPPSVPECAVNALTNCQKAAVTAAAKQQAVPSWLSGGDADFFDAAITITGDDCAWQSTVLDLCGDSAAAAAAVPTSSSVLDADRGAFLERLLSREASPFLSEVSGTSDFGSVFDGEEQPTLVGHKRGFLDTADFVDPFACPNATTALTSAVCATTTVTATATSNNKRRKCDSASSSSRSSTPTVPCSAAGSRSSSPALDGEGGTKRDTHNFLERCRRKDIKTNYAALQSQVPAIVGIERIPTGQILLHAVDFIKQLQEEERRFEAQIAQLKQANAALRTKFNTAA